jgi:2-polyprenyl-3-methyl-5-hydroxy-6-metoxy-1,4-benzoquinol methylase
MKLKEYHINSLEEDTVYWNVLCQVFDWLKVEPKKGGDILSVACGRLDEGGVLSDFFETRDIKGVDIDSKNIERARTNNPHIPGENLQIWDVCALQEACSDKFDLVLLRHPNPTEDMKKWKKILEHTLSAVKVDGLVILTTFHLSELQCILRMCLFLSIKIPMVTNNKFPHPITKMYDAYICVIQKGWLIRNFKQRLDTLMKAKNLPDMTSMDKAIRSLREII